MAPRMASVLGPHGRISVRYFVACASPLSVTSYTICQHQMMITLSVGAEAVHASRDATKTASDKHAGQTTSSCKQSHGSDLMQLQKTSSYQPCIYRPCKCPDSIVSLPGPLCVMQYCSRSRCDAGCGLGTIHNIMQQLCACQKIQACIQPCSGICRQS